MTSPVFVLFWAIEASPPSNDSRDGLGFTVHQTPDSAREWAEDTKKVRKAFGMFLAPPLCISGRGVIQDPNNEILNQLAREGAFFTLKQPEGFELTSGVILEVDDQDR